MRKLYLLILTFLLINCLPIYASEGWKSDSTGTYYEISMENYNRLQANNCPVAKNDDDTQFWIKGEGDGTFWLINGKLYRIRENGYRETRDVTINGKTFKINQQGYLMNSDNTELKTATLTENNTKKDSNTLLAVLDATNTEFEQYKYGYPKKNTSDPGYLKDPVTVKYMSKNLRVYPCCNYLAAAYIDFYVYQKIGLFEEDVLNGPNGFNNQYGSTGTFAGYAPKVVYSSKSDMKEGDILKYYNGTGGHTIILRKIYQENGQTKYKFYQKTGQAIGESPKAHSSFIFKDSEVEIKNGGIHFCHVQNNEAYYNNGQRDYPDVYRIQ